MSTSVLIKESSVQLPESFATYEDLVDYILQYVQNQTEYLDFRPLKKTEYTTEVLRELEEGKNTPRHLYTRLSA